MPDSYPQPNAGATCVSFQLLDQHVRLSGVGSTEHGAHVRDGSYLVTALVAADIHAIEIVHEPSA